MCVIGELHPEQFNSDVLADRSNGFHTCCMWTDISVGTVRCSDLGGASCGYGDSHLAGGPELFSCPVSTCWAPSDDDELFIKLPLKPFFCFTWQHVQFSVFTVSLFNNS